MRVLASFAVIGFMIATAVAAKRLVDRRGRNGTLYAVLVLFAFPIGVLATTAVVLLTPERPRA